LLLSSVLLMRIIHWKRIWHWFWKMQAGGGILMALGWGNSFGPGGGILMVLTGEYF